MRDRILHYVLAVSMIFAVSGVCAAEQPDFDRPPGREQAENVRKRIETMKMWRLTKALDLDEKTSARLFPLLNKNDRRRFEAEKTLREAMQELRTALREKRDERLKSLLDRLEQAHVGLMKVNEEERAELKKVLTVEQQAKYIVFQQDFDMEMRKMIEGVRERRSGRDGERPGPEDRRERPGADGMDGPFPPR